MRLARTWLTGIAAGAGLMYWLDPDRGRLRRHLTRDKALHALRREREVADKGARDLEHRAEGIVYRLRHAWRGEDACFSDEVLVERVRARLGRFASHPSAIDVRVVDGVATISGPILAREAELLLAAMHRVPGIRRVDDDLDRHERPGHESALQGAGLVVPRRRRLLRGENWMPAVRLVAGGLGLAAGIGGLTLGGRGGRVAALGGSLLALRAASNLSLRRLVGLGGRGFALHKTLTVRAPVATVYAYLRNFENMAFFMDHVREVHVHDGRSTWKVRGPAGTSFAFQVEIARDVPDQLIAWRTLPGQLVEHAGTVRLEKLDAGTTRIDMRVSYHPPAGALGELIGSLFRVDPKHALDEDMLRFKGIVELGRTHAHGRAVRREHLRPA